MQNKNLTILARAGQSIWYDNLSRDVLNSGELKQLISDGVLGLTSNPTIFKKAIADSSDYDMRITELLSGPDGAALREDTELLCEDLMVEDVRAAADLLMPVFESSAGNDGFASIEVSPKICHDATATVQAARRLHEKIGRPNIMIKIPATEAGLTAISETLGSGIHVNVTLIFSLDTYKSVVESYLSGLEIAKEKGQEISKLRSVASFFVSRVDVICNDHIDALVQSGVCPIEKADSLRDRIGIANSQLAYGHYLKTLNTSRFEALKDRGASLQRPLWASTGTKKPELPLTYYVEALAGMDTVNTLPPATLQAVIEASELHPALTSDVSDASAIFSTMQEIELPFSMLLDTLLEEGLASFEKSYDELLEALERKTAQIS